MIDFYLTFCLTSVLLKPPHPLIVQSSVHKLPYFHGEVSYEPLYQIWMENDPP